LPKLFASDKDFTSHLKVTWYRLFDYYRPTHKTHTRLALSVVQRKWIWFYCKMQRLLQTTLWARKLLPIWQHQATSHYNGHAFNGCKSSRGSRGSDRRGLLLLIYFRTTEQPCRTHDMVQRLC